MGLVLRDRLTSRAPAPTSAAECWVANFATRGLATDSANCWLRSGAPWGRAFLWFARIGPAAYPFFSHDRGSEADILAGHFQSTRDRVVATDGLVLVLHDTTEFTYQRENSEAIGITKNINSGKDKTGRLKHALGMSERLSAEAVGTGKSAVGEYIRRARVIGLTWPLPEGLGDAKLERRLFTPPGFHIGPTKPQPHWPMIQEELKGRGVTVLLLWEEYRAEHVDGYGYSRFCDLYVEWRKRITPTMRQTHVAGEKLFVDWAGDTIVVFDPITGAKHGARASLSRHSARRPSRWSKPS